MHIDLESPVYPAVIPNLFRHFFTVYQLAASCVHVRQFLSLQISAASNLIVRNICETKGVNPLCPR